MNKKYGIGIIFISMMLLFCGCGQKEVSTSEVDITSKWVWYSMENMSDGDVFYNDGVSKVVNLFTGKGFTFESDGEIFTLATGKKKENIHQGTIEKLADGQYNLIAKNGKAFSATITGDKLTIVFSKSKLTFEVVK